MIKIGYCWIEHGESKEELYKQASIITEHLISRKITKCNIIYNIGYNENGLPNSFEKLLSLLIADEVNEIIINSEDSFPRWCGIESILERYALRITVINTTKRGNNKLKRSIDRINARADELKLESMKTVVGFCRVDSGTDIETKVTEEAKKQMEEQFEEVYKYCKNKQYTPLQMICSFNKNSNFSDGNSAELLNLVSNDRVKKVVVLDDAVFGDYDMAKGFLCEAGVELEIIYENKNDMY